MLQLNPTNKNGGIFMSMKDVLEFANNNSACYLATVEGNKPHVRGMWMWFADETGFYFHTGTPKKLYKQLIENPNVEICFHKAAPPPEGSKTLRVSGKVEFIDDISLKTRLLEERQFLKAIGTGKPDDPMYSIFKISSGEAVFWSMETNMKYDEASIIKF